MPPQQVTRSDTNTALFLLNKFTMTAKCDKCGKFLPADKQNGICLTCETAEAVKKISDTTAPPPKTSVFKFEIPTYMPGQEGGIKTWLRQVEVRLKLANITIS